MEQLIDLKNEYRNSFKVYMNSYKDLTGAIEGRIGIAAEASIALETLKENPYDTDALLEYQLAFGKLRGADKKLSDVYIMRENLLVQLKYVEQKLKEVECLPGS